MKVTSGPCSGVAKIAYKKGRMQETSNRVALVGHTAEVRADVEYREDGKTVNCPRIEDDNCTACRNVVKEQVAQLVRLLPDDQQSKVGYPGLVELVPTRCVFK